MVSTLIKSKLQVGKSQLKMLRLAKKKKGNCACGGSCGCNGGGH